MRNFNSLVDAISEYEKEGYVEDFDLRLDHLSSRNYEYKIHPDEFAIDEFYRFEDDSSADEQSIIYAISSDKYRLKGLLISGHSIYSEPISDEMLLKLRIR